MTNDGQLIFEILEMNENVGEEAVVFNYTDLAECNKAEDSQVISKRTINLSELPNLNIQ